MINKNKTNILFDDYITEMLSESEESQYLFLKASFEDNWNYPEAILSAIRKVALVRGVKTIAQDAGINRENLYRALSKDGNPRFDTFLKIIDALGMQVSIIPKKSQSQN